MVNNKSSGIHACMKCHLTSISIETIVEMNLFYFQCTLYSQNITLVRFRSKKFRPQYCCTFVNITSVRFISQVIFIQKGSCQEVSYIFTKVIPFSKSLLFSKVQNTPLLRYSNGSFIRLQNTHPFFLLNIPQTAENQGFFESRQTVSTFAVQGNWSTAVAFSTR